MKWLLVTTFLLLVAFINAQNVGQETEQKVCQCTNDIYCTLREYKEFRETILTGGPELQETAFSWYHTCLRYPGKPENTDEFFLSFIEYFCAVPEKERDGYIRCVIKECYVLWEKLCKNEASEECRKLKEGVGKFNAMVGKYNARGYCNGLSGLPSMPGGPPMKMPSFG